MPEPVISPVSGVDPEQEVLLADPVGLALLAVLGLGPA
jgi:RNA polymerase sigma-70 factor (ECF subfamily)